MLIVVPLQVLDCFVEILNCIFVYQYLVCSCNLYVRTVHEDGDILE
jgi:hypothetical protein